MDSLQGGVQALIGPTLGAVFIGFAVACVVYGILMTQVFHYFRGYPLDRSLFKISVSVGSCESFACTLIPKQVIIIAYARSTYLTSFILKSFQPFGNRRSSIYWASRVLLLHRQLRAMGSAIKGFNDLVRPSIGITKRRPLNSVLGPSS